MAVLGYTFNPLGYVSRSKSPLCDVLSTYALRKRLAFGSCELSQPAFGSHFLLCKSGNCIKGDLDAPWEQHRPLQIGFAPAACELRNKDFGRSSENRKYNKTIPSLHIH